MFFQQVFLNCTAYCSALPITLITGLATAAFSTSLSSQSYDFMSLATASDVDNVFDATGIPPSPPYFQGRASNGPVWVEYLANNLGTASTNLAFGGATTGAITPPFLVCRVYQDCSSRSMVLQQLRPLTRTRSISCGQVPMITSMVVVTLPYQSIICQRR